MSGTVVVGIDGSTSARLALAWAWDFARATGRTLRALHTWRGATAPVYAPVVDLRRDERRAAREDAEGWMAAVVDTERSVPWRVEVVEGPPGPVLVAAAAAEEDCVLVVGTREHHGLGRVVHGSISHYVLSHADCPVVAVPPPRPEPVTVYPDPSEMPLQLPHVPRF
jgi:nucleotide-binding universal stress UspA family protein